MLSREKEVHRELQNYSRSHPTPVHPRGDPGASESGSH